METIKINILLKDNQWMVANCHKIQISIYPPSIQCNDTVTNFQPYVEMMHDASGTPNNANYYLRQLQIIEVSSVNNFISDFNPYKREV